MSLNLTPPPSHLFALSFFPSPRRVHCSYQVDFLKSSFWKSIIESKTKNETKTWVTKYYKWAEGLKGKGKGRSLSASNAAAEEPEDRQTHKTEPPKYLVIGMCASQALLFLFVIYLIVKQVRNATRSEPSIPPPSLIPLPLAILRTKPTQ